MKRLSKKKREREIKKLVNESRAETSKDVMNRYAVKTSTGQYHTDRKLTAIAYENKRIYVKR